MTTAYQATPENDPAPDADPLAHVAAGDPDPTSEGGPYCSVGLCTRQPHPAHWQHIAGCASGAADVPDVVLQVWTDDREAAMTSAEPGPVVSDDAVRAAIRTVEEDLGLKFETIDEGEIARAVLAAAGPYLIRDWVTALLNQYPHITPAQLSMFANTLPILGLIEKGMS